MSAEAVAAQIQSDIQEALKDFLGQKVTETTMDSVKSYITRILLHYVAAGTFETRQMPLVDINHREEILHLQNKIAALAIRHHDEKDKFEELAKIENEITRLSWRIDGLQDQIVEPTAIIVSFKDPVTYEPYAWRENDYRHFQY